MISDKNKIILGKLFKKYKDEQNISIVDIEHASISSTKTLYQSFNGEIIFNDQFYIDYSKFFNHEYKYVEEINIWLSNFIVRMIQAFDYYEENEFDNLYNEFITKMNDYKDFAIYHEYYQVIQSLFNYYINNKYLRLEEVEDYLNLIDIDLLPKELSLYLLDYMFRSNWNYINKIELYDLILKKMNIVDENHYLTKYVNAFICKYKSNFIASIKYLRACHVESIDKHNSYRAAQCLLALYGTYRNIDQQMAKEVSIDLLELKEKNISNVLKININFSVGMQEYLEGRYERSYNLFQENISKYNSLMPLLFQCSICSRLGLEYPKELFSKEIEERYDFVYLDYFRKKCNQEENDKLAKYVLKTVIPKKLKDEVYRNPYWSLFEYEMYDMANNDIKLKKYYVNFMKEVKKCCKDA